MWILAHENPNAKQTAFRVIISDNLSDIKNNIGNVFDSGVIKSSDNFIYINNLNLNDFTRYYYKVKWWDNLGNESEWSDIAYFETSILNRDKWRAKWIISKGRAKKVFSLHKKVQKATLLITGVGYYEVYINGSKVTDKVLTPIWTDYSKYVYYSTFDVTSYLKIGTNVIAVESGHSRYIKEYGYDEKYKILAQLHIKYDDGSEEDITTDDSWITKEGPITYNDIYNGEVFDERKDDKDWKSEKVDISWTNCEIDRSFSPKLISDYLLPPIRRVKKLIPKKILFNSINNSFIVDFGQNFSGWVRLKFNCEYEGQSVYIRYAELLDEEGNLNQKPNRTAKAEDVFICKEAGPKEYEPKFTYHGFRYVEVKGITETLNDSSIEGIVIHSDVEHIGNVIFISNDLLNEIHKLVLWSQRSNLMGIPTDCPQRDERMGWLGDSNLTAEEAIFNFWIYGLFREWIRQIAYSQRDDGSIPDVVPPYWPLYPADPAWGDEFIYLPYVLYLYYDDKDVLEEYYPYLKKWILFLLNMTESGILKFSKYGDWCPPRQIRPYDTSGELVSTWILLKDLKIMSKISKILGLNEDSEMYEKYFSLIKDKFNEIFLTKNTIEFPEFLRNCRYNALDKKVIWYYDKGSQTSQVLPLYLDIVPKDKKEDIIKYLVDDIIIRYDKHLNTGIIGTRYLLQVLSDNGYEDLAYDIANQTSYPSWGYMLKEGATTLWERWEYLTNGSSNFKDISIPESGMNSHNHIMFGTVDTWFYDTLLGIKIDENNPGFKKIRIQPKFPKRLKGIVGSTKTIRGTIYVEWIRNNNLINLRIKIPVNTSGLLVLDKKKVKEIYIKSELIYGDNYVNKELVREIENNIIIDPIPNNDIIFSILEKV